MKHIILSDLYKTNTKVKFLMNAVRSQFFNNLQKWAYCNHSIRSQARIAATHFISPDNKAEWDGFVGKDMDCGLAFSSQADYYFSF